MIRTPRNERRPVVARTVAKLAALLAPVALIALAGCASLGVSPWERDLLAEPTMSLDAPELLRPADDHVYFSKEASTGGRGFGGGGCGCN